MDPIRVLCVESTPEYMERLTFMLEGIGYEVIPARTGEEAVGLLNGQRIDGVLLEYDLPDGTGYAIRADMKRIAPDVPILLFAGVGSQTPFLIRFFQAYLRNVEKGEDVLEALAL
jgi:CheY-like chemotaxis protein